MVTELRDKVIEEQIEFEACSLSCAYFLTKYGYIQDAIRMQAVRWEAWDYLVALLKDFEKHKEVVILKARQLGISWLVAGYCLWKCLFNNNVRVLMLSQGEEEAWELVKKCRFIYNHLPSFLQIPIGHDARGVINFPLNGSEVKALASTDKAGRSTDATIVVRDELEYHPYAKENFSSIKPTVDAGGQMIDLSTVNKGVADSHFQDRFRKALAGENNTHAVFLSWRLRPVRQEGLALDDWFEQRVKNAYEPWQVEQEYPETLEQALSPLKTRLFFNEQSLKDMELDIMKFMEASPANAFDGMVRYYKPSQVGNYYVVYTDPSDGKTDPHVTIVMDWQTGECVAESHGKIPADECARIHDTLVRYYNNAFNSFEGNAMAGGKFGETIKNLNTPNQAQFHNSDGKATEGKFGQFSTQPMKRNALLGLEEAVRLKQIRIHSRENLNEFNSFIIPVDRDGNSEPPRATQGMHDDYIMAWAGVWMIKRWMPLGAGIVRTYHVRGR